MPQEMSTAMADNFSEDERNDLRDLLRHKETLDAIVKKEESWTFVLSALKSVAAWVVGVSAAIYVMWDWIKGLLTGVKP